MMSTTTDKLDLLDERVTKLEISGAKLDERLSSLLSSTSNLKWTIWSITFLLLLTTIYSAIGREGFHDVTSVYKPSITQQNNK